MSKRQIQIVGALFLALCLIPLALIFFKRTETDAGKYREMQRVKDVFGFVMSADKGFLGPVIRPLGLWDHYTKRFDTLREELLISGYLTNASIEVQDARIRRVQVVQKLDATVKDTDILICGVVWSSNSVTVTCRPGDVPRFRKGLAE